MKNKGLIIITLMILFAVTGFIGCKYQWGGFMLTALISGLALFYFTMEEYV